ncbi:MAG: hypothetical protein OXH69_13985 [Acidobacteria bacterium]|nr:hypothetical protein [Acidobacteriota bacterium]
MRNQPLLTGDRNEVLRAVRHVRNRWRLRVALRGIAVLVAAALGTLLASSYGLELFRFDPGAIVGFRIATYLVLLAAGWWLFVRPVSRRVSDQRVALYIEEHEPSLKATVLSAVEESGRGERDAAADHSPELVRRLIASAVARIRDIDMGRGVEQQSLRRSSSLLLAAGVAAALLFVFGPAYLRHGISALLTPTGSVEAASPYRIDVSPGDATVARGADQPITAQLVGFEAEEVDLLMRSDEDGVFDRLALIPLETEDGEMLPDSYEVLLFDLEAPTEYFVEAAGVESPTFTLDVVDLPYVDRLELEYIFPEYTGLEPRLVESGGDIAVLSGTEVRLRAVPTMGTAGGQLVLDEEHRTDLALGEDGSLTSSFVVEEEGFYRIDLRAPDGQLVTASPQYTIDVLTDQPPAVMFIRPGRDTTASAIEELFVEARADDDFGLRSLDLVYSVNGGPEEAVPLYDAGDDTLREVSAGHTFFLEELELEPGDFLSYYARAVDRNLAQQGADVKSDLYFIQVRRFSRDYRSGPSGGGGAGGGAGGGDARALSEAQRQVISATFNVIRDRATFTDEEFQENVVFLTLAQGRLREQVETLLRRMNSRVMPADRAFRSIAEMLPLAADAMRDAETALQDQDVDAALPHEQRSLQHLQRAEEAYEEVLLTMGGGGGGGGGSRASQAAEDLADLFELELDKLRNQYETLQRGEQQAADNSIDELMERLRELARRQEREAERQRRRARGQQSTQGGGAGQRALAEEAEEAARRLERLAREMNSPQMMDASRRLQEAADAMRRAAADNDNLGFAEAGAALDRLREVQERLQGEQSGRLQRDIEDQLRRANRLADEQREVRAEVADLPGMENEPRMTQLRRLLERKNEMESEVADLEREIDSTSAEFRRDERDAARRLQEAASSIRDNRLKEKIRYSRGLMRSRPGDTANAFENEIGSDIDELAEKLAEAAASVGKSEGDRMAQALDRTRDLMRSLESLDHRMWQEGREGEEGEAGSESGQEGQPGEQAGGEQAGGRQAGEQAGNQAGPADGDAATLGSRWGGPFGGRYGYDRRPGDWEWDPRDVRQWQREYRERAGEVEELRRLLDQEDFAAADLSEIIERMRELDDLRTYQDPEEIARLQTFVLEELKRFEYRLRREITEESEDLFLAGNEEMPPQFRELVEEYFRVLSEGQ